MSKFRDSLPPEQVPAYDACVRNAGRSLAEGTRAMHELAAEQGSLAVGKAAWYPGHPLGSPEAIAAAYEERIARARAAQEQDA